MFFWVGFGNAEKRMLNLDCRCSIVVDYMFREFVLGECEGYIARKRAEVSHSKEEIHANLEFLKGQLGAGAAGADGADGADGAGGADAAAPEAEGDSPPPEQPLAEVDPDKAADVQRKIDKLEEMLKTREFQEQALGEAAKKIAGADEKEIDVCDDTGTVLGLQGMGSVVASDVLEERAVYTLCRRVKLGASDGEGSSAKKKGGGDTTEKTVMLNFAVPPDNAMNLELLLGPSRITVAKKKKGGGRGKRGHTRSRTTRPKTKGRGMRDITNNQQKMSAGRGKHQRSRTSL